MSEFTTTELIERLKTFLGVKSDGEVADRLSISRAALSMKKVRNSSILNEVLILAQREYIDLNRLLLGEEPIQGTREDEGDFAILRDERGSEVHELKLSRRYLQSWNLDPENLVVLRDGQGNLFLIDKRVKKITSDGIYAINTDGTVLLKQATMRLDGSILFPSKAPEIPPEQISKSDADKLRIVGRVALVVAAPE